MNVRRKPKRSRKGERRNRRERIYMKRLKRENRVWKPPYPVGYHAAMHGFYMSGPFRCARRVTSRYLDREGRPMTPDEWMLCFEDARYRQIALTYFYPCFISTIWQGNDVTTLVYDSKRPLIFETVVLPIANRMRWIPPEFWEALCLKHTTEREARICHRVLGRVIKHALTNIVREATRDLPIFIQDAMVKATLRAQPLDEDEQLLSMLDAVEPPAMFRAEADAEPEA